MDVLVRKLTDEEKHLYGLLEKAIAKLPRDMNIKTLVPLFDARWRVLETIQRGELPGMEDINWFLDLADDYSKFFQMGVI